MGQTPVEYMRAALDITWADPDGDVRLGHVIEQGKSYLDGVAGVELDYEENAAPLELLTEYCKYARANALSDFEVNYRHMLLRLQMMNVDDDD